MSSEQSTKKYIYFSVAIALFFCMIIMTQLILIFAAKTAEEDHRIQLKRDALLIKHILGPQTKVEIGEPLLEPLLSIPSKKRIDHDYLLFNQSLVRSDSLAQTLKQQTGYDILFLAQGVALSSTLRSTQQTQLYGFEYSFINESYFSTMKFPDATYYAGRVSLGDDVDIVYLRLKKNPRVLTFKQVFLMFLILVLLTLQGSGVVTRQLMRFWSRSPKQQESKNSSFFDTRKSLRSVPLVVSSQNKISSETVFQQQNIQQQRAPQQNPQQHQESQKQNVQQAKPSSTQQTTRHINSNPSKKK